MSDFNNVNDLNDYYDGKADGYMGIAARDNGTEAYMTGWFDGDQSWEAEQDAAYGQAYDDFIDGISC